MPFLVACTQLYNLLCPSIRPSVCNTLLFWRLLAVLGLLLLPYCLVGLFPQCPCPPARDYGCRVSGLVFNIIHLFSLRLPVIWETFWIIYYLRNKKVSTHFGQLHLNDSTCFPKIGDKIRPFKFPSKLWKPDLLRSIGWQAIIFLMKCFLLKNSSLDILLGNSFHSVNHNFFWWIKEELVLII